MITFLRDLEKADSIMLPSFEVTSTPPDDFPVTALLVAIGLRTLGPGASVPRETAALRGFAGKIGESFVQADRDGVTIFLGAGEPEGLGSLEARRIGATFARSLANSVSALLDLRGASSDLAPDRLARAIVEGIGGALYRFGHYRSDPREHSVEQVKLLVTAEMLEATVLGAGRAVAVCEAVWLARDLGNRGSSDLTPKALAEEASAVAERAGLTIEVFEEEKVAAERLGGLAGVARGSAEPPRLIKMTYEPDESVARRGSDGKVPTVALVGKGITFDSGGLSLKPPDSMIGMKADMSGAAAVITAVGACRALGIGTRVVAIVPVAENMPGGRAIKPGDVITIRNGKTIEVLNTDAEGRLILADGLVLATEEEPDAIVDIATLTGACIFALGSRVAGVMGNDSRVVGALEAAARRAGEAVWRLPLPPEYRKDIDSQIADMKNMGKPRQGGALIAGLLLEEFVDERPWAHLDIAGPADSDEERYEICRGATGFGVRTLIEFLDEFERPADAGRPVADHLGVG
ncbi:MAG: leucyl aminopeptidase [Acidimicrobiales bacterium]